MDRLSYGATVLGQDCLCAFGASDKEVAIDYLYLDLSTCDRCVGTDAVLDRVVDVLRPALELAGYRVTYHKTEIATPQLAAQYRFLSSPTILVNGQDVFGAVTENDCGCCGDIAGVQVDCRVFEHQGVLYEVPTEGMLADAILRSVYTAPAWTVGEEYCLPDNLKRFFDGKASRTSVSCCCGGSCTTC